MKYNYKPMGLSSIREATATLAKLERMLGDWMVDKNILWVDDHPANNDIIKKLFEAAGATVILAQSTEEALATLQSASHAFDLVISDMVRGDNPIAGFDLFELMHSAGIFLAYIIYSSNPKVRTKQGEIAKMGAIGPVVGPENLINEISNLFI